MPIYEYQCEACGHEHEALQKISDAPLMVCPACNEPELKKKISAAGFRLKGGGWYETDFKSGTKKNVAGESSAPASSGGSCCSGGTCSSH
ncbi:FmdB family zinc ribbon protein [Methylomarinum vadi]|uniref:FmdB family zinc ribbon protein n=1 Tax=Methylomarinum vadi TaxID=438855 RepID=UPI0004DF2E29|nr:zinc ribbon domain-containing protein [Methylomarinum vadi]